MPDPGSLTFKRRAATPQPRGHGGDPIGRSQGRLAAETREVVRPVRVTWAPPLGAREEAGPQS